MDYLTILTTRSVVLFPRPSSCSKSTTHNPLLDSPASPSTPTTNLAPPSPISLPLTSLHYSHPDTAYFLLTHLLSGQLAQVDKETLAEAEVLVWKEIGKGVQLVRAIGEWFGGRGRGMSDKELKALAEACGLEMKDGGGGGEGDKVEVEHTERVVESDMTTLSQVLV